ncbi:MAG: cytochrome c3 family protein [Acidobacteriaceae bacterium]
MKYWRIVSLLILAGFWVQSAMSRSTTETASAQNTAATSVESPAQNSASAPSRATRDEAASSPPTERLQGPVQPVPFSHKQHAGTLNMPCEYCHTPSRSGETLAIPRASFCMQCHQTIATDNPGVQKLAAYAKSNATIPWVRIYELPSFVSFSHKVHLQHGATCQECHGPVAERARMYKESDISMAGCVNCHRAKQASTDCSTCHTLEQ